MSQLFWKPQEELIQQSWAFAQGSQIGRFVGLSTAFHFIFAALSPWLLLTFSLTSQEERLVIRVVDFVLPPETAPISEKRETKGGGGGGPVKPPKIAKPVRHRPSPVKRPAAKPPAPPTARKVADIPGPREIAVPSTPAREPALRPVGPAEVPATARFKSQAEDVEALAQSFTRTEPLPARPAQLAPEMKLSEKIGPRQVAQSPTPARESGPVRVEPSQSLVAARSGSEVQAVRTLAESLSKSGDLPTLPSRTASAPTPAAEGPKALGGPSTPRGSGGTGPAPVAGPSSQVAVGGTGAGGGEARQVVALARELSGGGEGGPIATAAPTPAARGPKALGGPSTSRGSGGTGPAAVAGPSSQVTVGGTGAGGGEARQVVALARELSGGGEHGPVATVAVPRQLVRGEAGGGGVGSGRGTGAGWGQGSTGSTGIGPGAGLVDTRDPDFSEYFRIIEKRVRTAWRFPESLEGTTQTVKLGFSLRRDGSLQDVRVVSSTSGTLNVSALTAMKRASPFPSLPAKFHALAGQPLVMSFTVTIK